MSKSMVKSFQMPVELSQFIKTESKKNGLTQAEFIRVAVKSMSPETLGKIREVRELVSA